MGIEDKEKLNHAARESEGSSKEDEVHEEAEEIREEIGEAIEKLKSLSEMHDEFVIHNAGDKYGTIRPALDAINRFNW